MGIGIAGRIFVALEASEIESVLINAEPFFIGKEFPTPCDALMLEIVAERPVAKHFKEGEMACIANLVYVAGTDTFLNIG